MEAIAIRYLLLFGVLAEESWKCIQVTKAGWCASCALASNSIGSCVAGTASFSVFKFHCAQRLETSTRFGSHGIAREELLETCDFVIASVFLPLVASSIAIFDLPVRSLLCAVVPRCWHRGDGLRVHAAAHPTRPESSWEFLHSCKVATLST